MALTATATQGFEFLRYVERDEVIWVPGDPGDTFTRGDLVTFSLGEGVADLIASDETPIGVVEKTVVCSAATTGFPTFPPGGTDSWGDESDVAKTLVQIRPLVPVGTPVWKATFASHTDDVITAYTAATPSITLTTDLGGNDDSNGALIYAYAGTGAGQWNIGADYVSATSVLTTHRKFETAVSTDTYFIILEGEGGGSALGIGFFGRCVPGDQNNLVVNNGANDGDFQVYLDARQVATFMKNLTLPVIASAALNMV